MEALTPDLAEKVLTAEVRNMIKKVGEGGTLSASARAMFHKAAMLPGLANDARVAALFAKWAGGGRLTSDELIELRAWSSRAADPETPPLSPAAASASPLAAAAPESFALAAEGPRLAGSRVKYPQTLSVYAERYNVDERSMKRYVARGLYADADKKIMRDPVDLPPFHAPAELPAWWARRMPNARCPAGFLDAAAEARALSPAPAPSAADPATPDLTTSAAPTASLTPPAVQRDFSEIRTLGIAENVEQLRHSLAVIQHQLEEARKGQVVEGTLIVDDALIASRQRDYRETFSELRKAENDLVAYQEKMGLLVLRDEVRGENNRIAAAIFRAVKRLVASTRPQLAGKTEAEQQRIWDEEVSACFATLKTAKFTSFDPAAE